MSPSVSDLAWTVEDVSVAGFSGRLRTLGSGAPLLLYHDIRTPEQLPFY
jgi:hypothetical protein